MSFHMLKRKKHIAFHPFISKTDSYINIIHQMIRNHCPTVDYLDCKADIYEISDIGIIYVNWIEDIMGNSDRLYLQKAAAHGVRIFWVFHNKLPHDRRLHNEEKRDDMRFLSRIADIIIIHSKDSIATLKAYNPGLKSEKVHYVPHPDFIGRYHDYCPDIRNRLGVKEEEILFALYGNLRPYKNIELLIKAMTELTDQNCRLLVAGQAQDTAYTQTLYRLTRENKKVTVLNRYIPDLQMGAFLKAADALVLPYDTTSGMNSGAMIMAFSYGRTVVVSDIDMSRDFPEALIYRYEYPDQEEHLTALIGQLSCACKVGRKVNHEKGQALNHLVKKTCSTEIVEASLRQLLRI